MLFLYHQENIIISDIKIHLYIIMHPINEPLPTLQLSHNTMSLPESVLSFLQIMQIISDVSSFTKQKGRSFGNNDEPLY